MVKGVALLTRSARRWDGVSISCATDSCNNSSWRLLKGLIQSSGFVRVTFPVEVAHYVGLISHITTSRLQSARASLASRPIHIYWCCSWDKGESSTFVILVASFSTNIKAVTINRSNQLTSKAVRLQRQELVQDSCSGSEQHRGADASECTTRLLSPWFFKTRALVLKSEVVVSAPVSAHSLPRS